MPTPSEMQEIVNDLSGLRHEMYHILEWGAGTSGEGAEDDRELVRALADADVITSKVDVSLDIHTVMLDLDVPARLIPSTTPGHSHLYIDVPMSWSRYKHLLWALKAACVIEPGYYQASVRRGFTSLRLPWIKKEEAANADH